MAFVVALKGMRFGRIPFDFTHAVTFKYSCCLGEIV